VVGAKAVETQDVVERIVTFKWMQIRHENVIGRSTRRTNHAGAMLGAQCAFAQLGAPHSKQL
jgi:hypothetical protein